MHVALGKSCLALYSTYARGVLSICYSLQHPRVNHSSVRLTECYSRLWRWCRTIVVALIYFLNCSFPKDISSNVPRCLPQTRNAPRRHSESGKGDDNNNKTSLFPHSSGGNEYKEGWVAGDGVDRTVQTGFGKEQPIRPLQTEML